MMLSRDKVLTKRVLATHGVATPAFTLFPFGRRFRAPARLEFPLFVKSATEDASLGISQASLVEDLRSLRERVELIHEQVQSDALVEEYVDGRELYVGVLGNAKLVTLPPWEMDFGTSAARPGADRDTPGEMGSQLSSEARHQEPAKLASCATSSARS